MKHSILGLTTIMSLTLLILTLTFGCKKTDVNSLKKISYIYRNTTGMNLRMEVYNSFDTKFKEYTIPSGAEITTHTSDAEGIAIFHYADNLDQIGDSVAIIFEDNKCLSYIKSKPDRIFRAKEYDNYSDELLEQREFSLIYSITPADYDSAGICN